MLRSIGSESTERITLIFTESEKNAGYTQYGAITRTKLLRIEKYEVSIAYQLLNNLLDRGRFGNCGRLFVLLEVEDKVLTSENFVELKCFCDETNFQLNGPGSDSPVWQKNAPHNPLVGSTLLRSVSGFYPPGLNPTDDLMLYPSGTPLDRAVDAAWRIAQSLIPNISEECVGVTATIFRYEPGSRLIWHKDQASLGAFTFYVSDWGENNGGQFAYKPDGSPHGGFIEPLPNRLVVFASGLDHCVMPVAADAPNARISISGFFIDMARAMALMSSYASAEQVSGPPAEATTHPA